MNKSTRYRRFCNINIFASILTGSLVYIFLYQDSYIQIYEKAIPLIKKVREIIYSDILYRSSIGLSIRNHLTDYLWAYSFAWVYIRYSKEYRKDFLKCCIICTLLECLQFVPPLNRYSTFDLVDIIIQILGVFLANIVNMIFRYYIFHNKTEQKHGS